MRQLSKYTKNMHVSIDENTEGLVIGKIVIILIKAEKFYRFCDINRYFFPKKVSIFKP